jgi:hypothetical protein
LFQNKNYLGALSRVGPGLAVNVEVVAVVLALVAGEGTTLQHPAWVLLTFTLFGPGGTMTVRNVKFNLIASVLNIF